MSVDVGPVGDFPLKRMRIVDIDARQIGIVRWDNRVFAVGNLCSHQGGPLCQGVLSARLTAAQPGELMLDESSPTLACPWHGWEFDLRSGRALLDQKLRIRTFAALIADGRVLVDLDASGSVSAHS
jgi:3-phenylpropionate/trans-cinnamate dioxygenase ferredoxin subunit